MHKQPTPPVSRHFPLRGLTEDGVVAPSHVAQPRALARLALALARTAASGQFIMLVLCVLYYSY